MLFGFRLPNDLAYFHRKTIQMTNERMPGVSVCAYIASERTCHFGRMMTTEQKLRAPWTKKQKKKKPLLFAHLHCPAPASAIPYSVVAYHFRIREMSVLRALNLFFIKIPMHREGEREWAATECVQSKSLKMHFQLI